MHFLKTLAISLSLSTFACGGPSNYNTLNYHAINFTDDAHIFQNVKSVVGNRYVESAEIVQILSRIPTCSTQAKVGAWLIQRISDPNNIGFVVHETPCQEAKVAITHSVQSTPPRQATSIESATAVAILDGLSAVNTIHSNRAPAQAAPSHTSHTRQNSQVLDDGSWIDSLDLTFCSKSLENVQLSVGKKRVTAKAAAKIVDKINCCSAQAETGAWLAERLDDREHYQRIIDKADCHSAKDAIKNALLNSDNDSRTPHNAHDGDWVDSLDFSFCSRSLENVQMALGSNRVSSHAAARIISKINCCSEQGKTGAWLAERLIDRENYQRLIDQADCYSAKDAIKNAIRNSTDEPSSNRGDHHRNQQNHSRPNARILSDGAWINELNLNSCSNSLDSVKSSVGQSQIKASAAAHILKRITCCSAQADVGAWLAKRLEDRENYQKMTNAVSCMSAQDAIKRALK